MRSKISNGKYLVSFHIKPTIFLFTFVDIGMSLCCYFNCAYISSPDINPTCHQTCRILQLMDKTEIRMRRGVPVTNMGVTAQYTIFIHVRPITICNCAQSMWPIGQTLCVSNQLGKTCANFIMFFTKRFTESIVKRICTKLFTLLMSQ